MEGEDADTTTTRRRTRMAKPTHSMREKDEDELEESPPAPRISSSLKRKANITVENLYLQGNYKDPLPTALETIFESPRPVKNQRADSPEAPALMARRKLKRLCVFGSHYQPTRTKLKQRKERALRMRQLTGVRVPLGKAFSEDDVLAALSCLTEEEAATANLLQDPEKELLYATASDTLVEKVTSVFSSLQMDCEPSLTTTDQDIQEAAPALPDSSREQRRKRRSGLVVNPSSPLTSASSDESQPALARAKRLKRRSGLVFVDKTSNLSTPPTSPQGTSGDCPSQAGPSKTAQAQRKTPNPSPVADQDTTAPKVPRVRSGNKRTPDSSPVTLEKKQCIPSTTTRPPAPPSTRGKGRGGRSGRSRGKRRVSGVERSLYHYNVPATDSPNTSPTPSNTRSPAIMPETPPLPTPSPTHKRDLSPKLEESDQEVPTVISNLASPTSPSTRMAALSIHPSPSPLPKPKKVRRRSARLSFGGSDGLEETQKKADNYLPLGTFWMSLSPMERKAAAERAAQGGCGDGGGRSNDDPPVPSSITSRKKQSKGRRRSNQFLPIPERMEFEAATTALPTFSIMSSSPPQTQPFPEAVKSPVTSPPHLSSPSHNSTSPTHSSLTGAASHPGDPQVISKEGRETSTHQGMGKEVMEASDIISPYSSSESSLILSPKNTAFCEPLEGCIDLLTPSPTSAITPSPKPSVTLTPSAEQPPRSTLTPSMKQPRAIVLTPSMEHPSDTTLTPTAGQPSATALTPTTELPSAITPAEHSSTTLTPTTEKSHPSCTTSTEQPLATTFTPCRQQPCPTLTPTTEQTHTTFTPSTEHSHTTLTPSTEKPHRTVLTTSMEQPSATALTPSTECPHSNCTPSLAQAVATNIPSPRHPSATLTPSASTLTPKAPQGDQSTNSDEDWDSPIIAGLLTNETLIRMGQVYYGSPLSTPSSARV